MVGERWALLIVRELLIGPKRFTDLRAGLPNASQNVLSHRLRELELSGVVGRHKLGPPASTWVYELTARGYELEPVVLALGRWGSQLPLTTDAELGLDALIVALKTTFDPSADPALRAVFCLKLEENRFRAEVDGDRFEVTRGHVEAPDAVITTDAATFRSLVFGGRELAGAEVKVHGDHQLLARFLKLFPRPQAL